MNKFWKARLLGDLGLSKKEIKIDPVSKVRYDKVVFKFEKELTKIFYLGDKEVHRRITSKKERLAEAKRLQELIASCKVTIGHFERNIFRANLLMFPFSIAFSLWINPAFALLLLANIVWISGHIYDEYICE